MKRLVLCLALCSSPALGEGASPGLMLVPPAGTSGMDTNSAAAAQMGQAVFIGRDGTELGAAEITQTPDGVRIIAELTNIPAGEHGFHVHETGDCDPTTGFESAGGHFAPGAKQHGLQNPQGPHEGDMPNQVAVAIDAQPQANASTPDAGGEGNAGLREERLLIDAVNPLISLGQGVPGYLFDEDGSALVVHAGPDDGVTDPSGNSGDRIACGVIEAVPVE